MGSVLGKPHDENEYPAPTTKTKRELATEAFEHRRCSLEIRDESFELLEEMVKELKELTLVLDQISSDLSSVLLTSNRIEERIP